MIRIASSIALGLLLGCNPEQSLHRADRDQTPDAANLTSQDRDFIEKAAQGNNAEVYGGMLAKGRTTTASVIAFGEMMVTDHSAANVRLIEIGRQLKIALPTSLGDHQAGYDRLVDNKHASFDAEFARVMVEDHQTAVRLYHSEIASGTDPRLREYAASMLPRIEAHLEQAKTLLPLEDDVTVDDRHVHDD